VKPRFVQIVPSRASIPFSLLVLTFALSVAGGSLQQIVPQGDAQPSAVTIQDMQRRLAEASTNLAAAQGLGGAALTNAPAGVSLQDIAIRRALLSRLVRLLEQQLSDLTELETAKARRADLARKAQAWTRFADPPPYSILLPDRLREEIKVEQFKSTAGKAAVSGIDQLMGALCCVREPPGRDAEGIGATARSLP